MQGHVVGKCQEPVREPHRFLFDFVLPVQRIFRFIITKTGDISVFGRGPIWKRAKDGVFFFVRRANSRNGESAATSTTAAVAVVVELFPLAIFAHLLFGNDFFGARFFDAEGNASRVGNQRCGSARVGSTVENGWLTNQVSSLFQKK